MYKIGELSKLCKLPVKTLRYYDSVGLLVPDRIDRFTGYRYYSPAKLADCNRIVALKELSFSLDEIRLHLSADSAEDIAKLIDRKTEELRTAVTEAESQLKRLAAAKEIIIEGDKKMFDLVIRKSDSIEVAFLRKVFESKEEAAKALASMKSALPQKLVGQRTVIINYETDYRESDFDLAVCVEICGSMPKDTGYEQRTLSFSGDVASVICKSDELDAAYRSIEKQLHDLPAQISGAFYEVCYDDDTIELKVPVYRYTKADRPTNEERNLPFVNDPEALGKWRLVDVVPSEEQFLYGHEKGRSNDWLRELYFLKDGEPYWVIRGWTKGSIYFKNQYRSLNLKYTTKEVDGHRLLFLEMSRYMFSNEGYGKNEIWVYEKVSDEIFTRETIRRRDCVDYPFVPDEAVLGEWKVFDFYHNARDFDPSKQNWHENELFLKSLTFSPDGICAVKTESGRSNQRWTKGLVLNARDEIAPAYEITTVNGIEYLIFEWKSGDYAFRPDAKTYYYVLKRA